MNILVTGNLGYIGSVIVPILKSQGHVVIGYDSGYFDNCLLEPSQLPDKQIRGDIRQIEKTDISNCDAVIHLAGLSNDPLGELNASLTDDINLGGTLRIAEIAKKIGVERFVFASSQSIYGVADTAIEIDEDDSIKAPVTAYARTKWQAECELKKICNDQFTTVAYRPSTVFGSSPRLRCDIVYNNFLACAFTTNKIEIKSDGTPWRPVIHIVDVCKAFISGLTAPKRLIAGRAFNVGIQDGNFTVRDIANAAHRLLPESEITYTNEHGPDSRTYKVSFERILTELKEHFTPQYHLTNGGRELLEQFARVHFTKDDFLGVKTNRLKKIQDLQKTNYLDEELFWT